MNKDAFPLDALEFIKGNPVTLGGRVVVVEVWATWCPPCRSSIPHLTELAHRYADSVSFMGVTSEAASVARPFVQQMGAKMDYNVACDPTGVSQRYMQAFGLQGIPAAIIVDAAGERVVVVWGGHPMDDKFEEQLKRAVAASAPPPAKQRARVSLRGETGASLGARAVKELKLIAADNGVDLFGLLEKDEIVAKLLASQ